jgi:hypothetical protein
VHGLSRSFDVAQRALAAAAESADGRGPPTQLLPAILRHLRLTTPDELIGWWVSSAAHSALRTSIPDGSQQARVLQVCGSWQQWNTDERVLAAALRTDGPQPCRYACSVIVVCALG